MLKFTKPGIIEKFVLKLKALGLSKNQWLSLGVLAFLLWVLPLTLALTQVSQETRRRAMEPPLTSPVTPTPTPSSRFKQAVQFTGECRADKMIYFPQGTHNINLVGDFTIETWLYMLENGGATRRDIFSTKSFTSSNVQISLGLNYYANPDPSHSNIPHFFIHVQNNPLDHLVGTTNLQPRQWHHLAGVKRGNTLLLFVNGKMEASETIPFTIPDNLNSEIAIGAHPVSGQPYSERNLGGIVEEMRISNTARYTQNFNLVTIPFSPDGNTLALWHFDNNTIDASSRNQPGIIYGQVLFVESYLPLPQPISPAPTSYPCATPTPTPILLPTPTRAPTPTPILCPAPTLRATAVSSNQINLSWNAVPGASHYTGYYRAEGTTEWAYLPGMDYSSNYTATTYSHTGLLACTTYVYYLQVFCPGASNWPLSNQVSATTLGCKVTPTPTPTPITYSPQILTTSLPIGYVGRSYSAQVRVTDQDKDLEIVTLSGLPPGLSYTCQTSADRGEINCQISGKPAQIGSYSVKIVAFDNFGHLAQKTLTLRIYRWYFWYPFFPFFKPTL